RIRAPRRGKPVYGRCGCLRSCHALSRVGHVLASASRWDELMAVVAGVDFGTLSVRVSVVDSERGMRASAVSEYPLHRKREDPEYATQSHDDHMRALAEATREAVKQSGISGDKIAAIPLDTTASSVMPVARALQPLV